MKEKRTGTCGEHITWQFDGDSRKLTIGGSGPMNHFDKSMPTPWAEWREEIRHVVIEEGVTMLSDCCFMKCVNLEIVEIPKTVDTVGYYSFSQCISLKSIEIPEGVRILESKAFSYCESLETIKLPASLEGIDMKCFADCPALREVVYAGTEEMWDRIRISTVGDGNTEFCATLRRCEGKVLAQIAEKELDELWHREKTEVVPVLDMAREILEKDGDGRLHILAFENRMECRTHKKSGDASLVIFPDGQTMMIDVGDINVEEKMLSKLRRLNLRSLDYICASHSHGDHIGNGIAVADYLYGQGGKIGTYFYIDVRIGKYEPKFYRYVEEKGVKMRADLKQGDAFEIGGVKVDILGPTESGMQDYDNNLNCLSVIMKLSYGKSSYLTAGDLFRNFERRMVKELGGQLKADVMKANHHGIRSSSSDEWMDAVDPVLVIAHHDDIGSTENYRDFKARGISYLTTGLRGTIMVSMSEDGTIDVVTEYGDTFTRKAVAE